MFNNSAICFSLSYLKMITILIGCYATRTHKRQSSSNLGFPHTANYTSKWVYHGRVLNGANISILAQMDLRLPDLGRNQKMVSFPFSDSSYLCQETGMGFVILGMSVTMHERQDSTKPDHGI